MSDCKAGMRDWVAHLRSWSVLCSLLSVGTLLGTRQRPCERESGLRRVHARPLGQRLRASRPTTLHRRLVLGRIKLRYGIRYVQSIFFGFFLAGSNSDKIGFLMP